MNGNLKKKLAQGGFHYLTKKEHKVDSFAEGVSVCVK